MKVTLKVKTPAGGMAFSRCDGCKQKRTFPSFKKAEVFAKAGGHTRFCITRVRGT